MAHYVGSQPYDDSNTSRSSTLTALFTFGEGYHNYHHAFESDYRIGVKWWQYDPGKWLITLLSWVGLAQRLHRFNKAEIAKKKLDIQFKKALQTAEKVGHRGAFLAQLNNQREHSIVAFDQVLAAQEAVDQLKSKVGREYKKSHIYKNYLHLRSVANAHQEIWNCIHHWARTATFLSRPPFPTIQL